MPVLLARPAERDAFEELLLRRKERSPGSDEQLLRAAFLDAQEMYGEAMHWTGERMLAHCVGVLEMYLAFDPDDEGVIACLLHHALDVKIKTLEELEHKYGPAVRSIVSGVHLLSHVTMENRRMSLENLRLMFMRVSDDIRVVLLILCDHSYKLGRLDLLSEDDRRNICRDVLSVFAPVAARLGIYSLKHQMEANAFPVVYPTDAARIGEQLSQIHERHGYFLDRTAATLHEFLKESGIPARVEGREKQAFSMFQKMKQKSLTHVEDIYDLFALRVIVKDEAACYQTLGVLHRIGHPVVNRFKDYIAFPKPNGYQSLHTTLARLPGAPEGVCIEVQIRTEAMHREADLGIAAHWSYKEGGAAEKASRRAKLQRALGLQQSMEDMRRPTLRDHIFALTPKGDIIELPEGSTPLDFAFHVHTTLGLCFKAARVNGNIVPLTHALENGDIVEILRNKEPQPTPNWITVLKTSSARSRLKRYLAEQDRPMYVLRGREALNAELLRHKLPSLDPDLSIMRSYDSQILSSAEREDILMQIGQGAQSASSILYKLDVLKSDPRLRLPQEQRKIPPPAVTVMAEMDEGIPMPVRYARCCKPDEGERVPIAGVIGRDGAVRVHRAVCKMYLQANPERTVGVHWEEVKK